MSMSLWGVFTYIVTFIQRSGLINVFRPMGFAIRRYGDATKTTPRTMQALKAGLQGITEPHYSQAFVGDCTNKTQQQPQLGKIEGDPKQVVSFEEDAAQGNAEAQYQLGMMWFKGECVSQDKIKALEFYHQAAAQGHARALSHLGLQFYQGDGVPQDVLRGIQFISMAIKLMDQSDADLAELKAIRQNWKQSWSSSCKKQLNQQGLKQAELRRHVGSCEALSQASRQFSDDLVEAPSSRETKRGVDRLGKGRGSQQESCQETPPRSTPTTPVDKKSKMAPDSRRKSNSRTISRAKSGEGRALFQEGPGSPRESTGSERTVEPRMLAPRGMLGP